MAKPDLTRRYIAEAFKLLVSEDDYDSVTIQRIVDTCDLNRKTFYYHFVNKDDLVRYIFRSDLASCLLKSFDLNELLSDSGVADDKYRMFPCYYKEPANDDRRGRHTKFYWTFSNYFKNAASFYQKLAKSSGWSIFINYVSHIYQPIIAHTIQRICNKQKVTTTKEEMDYLSAYFTNASVIWIASRHAVQNAHFADSTKQKLGTLILDAMNGAITALGEKSQDC